MVTRVGVIFIACAFGTTFIPVVPVTAFWKKAILQMEIIKQ
jgi:hypothetical protein